MKYKNDNIIKFNKKDSSKKNKEVRVIGFIQDDYKTDNDFKLPVPKEYMSESKTIPFNILEEMKDIKNSWCDLKGNIHFSKDYIPEPYIGNDNEVYLHLGNLVLEKKKDIVMNLMNKGIELLKKVS